MTCTIKPLPRPRAANDHHVGQFGERTRQLMEASRKVGYQEGERDGYRAGIVYGRFMWLTLGGMLGMAVVSAAFLLGWAQ